MKSFFRHLWCVCFVSGILLFPANFLFSNDSNWLETQQDISISKLIANISPEDGVRGVVIASPSKQDPDYYYHWVRDAALVMNVVADLEPTEDLLFDFAAFSRENQLASGFGSVGEPKYYVSGKPYDLPWGRPQNDGPALRALALIKFANQLLDEGRERVVRDFLYSGRHPADSVIKVDLEYVAKYWPDRCVDLWEERWGHHFYTRLAQRRALVAGAALAVRLNDSDAASWYLKQAKNIEREILNHRSVENLYILSTLNGPDERETGLDVSVILAVLHTYDEHDLFFSASNDWVLSTVFHLKKEFEKIYPMNQSHLYAPLIGRYPEDVYYGGNPWFLTTLAFAELYYKVLHELNTLGVIEVTKLNLDFLKSLFSFSKKYPTELVIGNRIDRSDEAFDEILSHLKSNAEAYFHTIKRYVDAKGSMSEQISKNTGAPLSARDLTWSYASFLTALWARNVALESY